MSKTMDQIPYMTTTTFEKKVWPAIKDKPSDQKPEYVIVPYDSIETLRRIVVVVSDFVTAPTVVRSPHARSNRNIMAVVVPALSALTLPLQQRLTGVVTEFITIRHLRTGRYVAGKFDQCQQLRVERRARVERQAA